MIQSQSLKNLRHTTLLSKESKQDATAKIIDAKITYNDRFEDKKCIPVNQGNKQKQVGLQTIGIDCLTGMSWRK